MPGYKRLLEVENGKSKKIKGKTTMYEKNKTCKATWVV